MTIERLYSNLCEAYSDKNLNKLAADIIDLYKERHYSSIIKISRSVSAFYNFDFEKVAKCYAKLIKIYHPDKGQRYRQEINNAYKQNDTEKLKQFTHIFTVMEWDTSQMDEGSYIDIDYQPEYIYDFPGYGFDVMNDMQYEEGSHETFENIQPDVSFFAALKRKIYGHMNIDLPMYYLIDLEDIEMADYEINSLDGIDHCRQLNFLDLSQNSIIDISDLKNLTSIEQLYLASNEIIYIDVLVKLYNLRVLDISDNYIEDITPLFYLNRLDYVNLAGNDIPQAQIRRLLTMGVRVQY